MPAQRPCAKRASDRSERPRRYGSPSPPPEVAKDGTGSITLGVISGLATRLDPQLRIRRHEVAHRLATRSTVYRIGSIHKAVHRRHAACNLVDAGAVSLSDPVEKYLPEVKQIGSKPQGAPPFTFLQLATMTAGLARDPRQEGPFWTGQVADWDKIQISALPHTDYISYPGTEFSSIRTSATRFSARRSHASPVCRATEWERTRVLAPLGMTHTRFEIDPNIGADLATGYEVNRDGSLDDQPAATDARDGRAATRCRTARSPRRSMTRRPLRRV